MADSQYEVGFPSQRAEAEFARAMPVLGFLAQYRLRVGDYRVFYDVDDTRRRVILLAIRRRHEHTYA